MLTTLDEMPWHQFPDTFDHVATSDPRFFDRHWFAIYDQKGSAALQATMGVYSNMNVADAGFVAVVGEQQANVRSSRTLRPRMEMVVDPISIEVVQPFQSIRIRVEPTADSDTSADLIWTARWPASEEAPHFIRKRGRVTDNYRRYEQLGSCTGWFDPGTGRREVEDWWAVHDHSWGVRPGMGMPEPLTGPDDVEAVRLREKTEDTGRVTAWGLTSSADRFLNQLTFFTTPRLSGHVLFFYRGDDRVRLDSVLYSEQDGAIVPVKVSDCETTMRLVPGTDRFEQLSARLHLDDGQTVDLEMNAQGRAVVMAGLGYSGGYDDGRGLGVWRGHDLVERDIWELPAVDEVVFGSTNAMSRPLHRLQPVTVTARGAGLDGVGTGSTTLVFNGLPPRGMELPGTLS